MHKSMSFRKCYTLRPDPQSVAFFGFVGVFVGRELTKREFFATVLS